MRGSEKEREGKREVGVCGIYEAKDKANLKKISRKVKNMMKTGNRESRK